jgi:hypothetical protein
MKQSFPSSYHLNGVEQHLKSVTYYNREHVFLKCSLTCFEYYLESGHVNSFQLHIYFHKTNHTHKYFVLVFR